MRLIALAAALAGCHPSWPAPQTPGKQACDDPCRATTCPTGNRCVWNDGCQPSCEPQYPRPGFKP